MNSQILRRPQVQERTGLSQASIYRLIRLGRFPRPIRIGVRAVGWRQEELEEWIKEREHI